MDIVGRKHNTDLPLFAQLYILKQVMTFYDYVFSYSPKYLILSNLMLHTSCYLFFNKLMYMRKFPLFSFGRVFLTYFASELLSFDYIVRDKMTKQIRVNINDLFDLDEQFLFQNEHFKRLIKRTYEKHGHLVN